MNERSYWVWLCVVALSLFPTLATAQITDPLRLHSGLLAGPPGSDQAVRVYKGIPYAAPPVGNLRWRLPQPPQSWEGVRTADAFAPGCVQQVAGSRLPWTEYSLLTGNGARIGGPAIACRLFPGVRAQGGRDEPFAGKLYFCVANVPYG